MRYEAATSTSWATSRPANSHTRNPEGGDEDEIEEFVPELVGTAIVRVVLDMENEDDDDWQKQPTRNYSYKFRGTPKPEGEETPWDDEEPTDESEKQEMVQRRMKWLESSKKVKKDGVPWKKLDEDTYERAREKYGD